MSDENGSHVTEILANELGRLDADITRLGSEIAKLMAQINERNAQRTRLSDEKAALERVMTRLGAALKPGFGPTEAIARVVEEHNGELTRSEVFDRAVAIINTPSARPRKVIDSTYRNLIGKRYDEHGGKVFLRAPNGNGHAL